MKTKILFSTGDRRRHGKEMRIAAKAITLLLAVFMMAATGFGQTSWTTDKNHSQLHFSAVHFGISHIEGVFRDFTVTMVSEKEDFSDAQVEMVAQISSI